MAHRRPDQRSAYGRAHEEGLVDLIEPSRRARFKEHLKKAAAGGADIVPDQGWDPRWITDVRGMSTAAIERSLRSKGAPERCWAMSNIFDPESLELPLHEAIIQVRSTEHFERSLISCIPGRLAYYDDRDDYIYLILERPGAG